MHSSTFKLSSRFSAPPAGGAERVRPEARGRTVSIGPTARHLPNRRYVERKPLFTQEHRASIMKKSRPEKEEPSGEPTSMKLQVPRSQNPPTERLDLSLPSASIGEPSSDLQTQLFSGEPASGLSFHDGSVLEGLNIPLRPQLSSTFLHPTSTPRSQNHRASQTRLRLREEKCTKNQESSYQRDYWACAVPKAPPPSADRSSSTWNPNQEYETLLDYTYPLRPGHVSSQQKADSPLGTDANMQDSGIELDQFCSLSGLDLSDTGGGGGSGGWSSPPAEDQQNLHRTSAGSPSSLSEAFRSDHSKARTAAGGGSSDGPGYRHHPVSPLSPSSALIQSSLVLPRSGCSSAAIDEDFWPLPEQLEELQQLSRQTRELTAHLSPPLPASYGSLEDISSSMVSSITSPQNRVTVEQNPEVLKDQQDGGEGFETSAQTAAGGAIRFGAGPGPTGLRECLGKQQLGLCSQEHKDSLMKLIQVFCSQLELLIQQLYGLSESMERAAAPAGDVDSLKSALAHYQSFQKDVSSHQPLTSCVLQAGQHLLSSITAVVPFLRDALLMIERQSGALQTHSDLWLSSILSAVDTLAPLTHRSSALLREERNSAGT
ncbi:centrosomal protein of 68 kDa isoform X3 [Cyprinodon tularosa]|uniref:centrosomal protein of 68 kDa isoform X3 n=1 Tax=Cyprinodon tularosa TaxID=77115 RepID=UPI0018E28A61|nr:centrosomal protein of 68 kDa isoform X3 [Cyprinodon tularosa]